MEENTATAEVIARYGSTWLHLSFPQLIDRALVQALFLSHVQGISVRPFPALVNFVPTVAYLFCLNLPAAFSQVGNVLIEIPCTGHKIVREKIYFEKKSMESKVG